VIGIGAGNGTDGQILVMHDALGITARAPKFAKNFLAQAGNLHDAIRMYIQEVEDGIYPSEAHSFS
ncbi:3-methyl-2-oxobutanoate hydroxymethyltransferase, partial [Escherichia coli]